MVPTNTRAELKNATMPDFDVRMKSTLHKLECEQGSRFNIPGMDLETVRRAWMDPAPPVEMNYE